MSRLWLLALSFRFLGAILPLVVWIVWLEESWAGEPTPYPRAPAWATELPPGVPPADSSPSQQPLRDWRFFRRPLGCWSSFNGSVCSSLLPELPFAFGPCRTFFGEPCLKSAPPSPLPPGPGHPGYVPPGYGPPG